MRNALLVILIMALPASAAAAEQTGGPKPDNSTKLLPVRKNAGAVNSCAVYGAGFVKVEGSDTCVKIGGSVIVETGSGGSFSRR